MAKNDYFAVVCRILAYLYACLKSDVEPQEEEISPKKLDIEPKYWIYIIENLQNSGYISGVHIGRLLEGMPAVKMLKLRITPAGIEFLQENFSVNKAKEFLKTLKEIIPGL